MHRVSVRLVAQELRLAPPFGAADQREYLVYVIHWASHCARDHIEIYFKPSYSCRFDEVHGAVLRQGFELLLSSRKSQPIWTGPPALGADVGSSTAVLICIAIGSFGFWRPMEFAQERVSKHLGKIMTRREKMRSCRVQGLIKGK